MHTLLDCDGHLPAYINITDGKTAEYRRAYDVPLLKGNIIVADRFYNDSSLLNVWDGSGVYFVVRHKDSIKFKTLKELELPKNRHQHVLKDEIIELTWNKTKDKYPGKLRRVALWDDENQQTVEVITNQMFWTANTITELYKAR